VLDLLPRELVDRVYRNDGIAISGHLGIETGGSIAAAEESFAKVLLGKLKHQLVLSPGTAKGNDSVK
jgi:hypothetical protein